MNKGPEEPENQSAFNSITEAQLICNLNTTCLVDTNQTGSRRSQIDLFILTEFQFNWPSGIGIFFQFTSRVTVARPIFSGVMRFLALLSLRV